MNVLSLFDGMSGAQIALNKAGIDYDNYYASEIFEKSIQVTMENYPNTINIGDIKNIDDDVIDSLPKIDLLIFGFPCKNISRIVANNKDHNQGLMGKHSSLFFNAVEIMNKVKPKYFIVENVGSIKNNDLNTVTELVGVEPVFINSSLFSAQNRDRVYWTNIDFDKDIEPSDAIISDIIEDEVDEKYYYNCGFEYNKKGQGTHIINLDIKGHDIIRRVYDINGKSPALTAVVGGNQQKKIFHNGRCRKLTPLEYERLQTVPDGYTSSVADTHRYRMLGDGFTIDVIAHILKGIKQDK